MRALIAAVLLAPSLVIAQPGATLPEAAPPPSTSTSPELLGLARGAHVAGARGDCVGARTLAARIKRLDPDFHAAVIATDSNITACRPSRFRIDEEEPAILRPTSPTPAVDAPRALPADSGRNALGQLFIGGLAAAGAGFLGGLIGVENADDEFAGLIIGGGLGLIAGSTVGVIFAGDNAGSDYSLGWTIAGSAAGTFLSMRLTFGTLDDGNTSPVVAIGVLVGGPTLGAMLGFNMSRRTLHPQPSLRVAVPAAPRISDATTSLPLLSGSF